MTEAEWLACDDPRAMLTHVRESTCDRRLRYLMVTPVLRVIQRLGGKHSQHHIKLLEQYAAGELSRTELTGQWGDHRKRCNAFDVFGFPWGDYPSRTLFDDTSEAALWFLRRFLPEEIILHGDDATWHAADASMGGTSARRALNILAGDIRDIFGNPFRPVAFSPAWRTETTVALASGIYAERAFDRMPILADALEEAGCDHPDVLAHCCGPGPHVRGCWVVDGVLGKS
jgi:hypothetical protein